MKKIRITHAPNVQTLLSPSFWLCSKKEKKKPKKSYVFPFRARMLAVSSWRTHTPQGIFEQHPPACRAVSPDLAALSRPNGAQERQNLASLPPVYRPTLRIPGRREKKGRNGVEGDAFKSITRHGERKRERKKGKVTGGLSFFFSWCNTFLSLSLSFFAIINNARSSALLSLARSSSLLSLPVSSPPSPRSCSYFLGIGGN